jgi:hypothetical protein
MKLIHRFAELPPEKRPQDPHMDGTGLRFETMEHGGEYPDTMPQAIKLLYAEGRSCIYVPITQAAKWSTAKGIRLTPRKIDEPRSTGDVDGGAQTEAEHWNVAAADLRDLGQVVRCTTTPGKVNRLDPLRNAINQHAAAIFSSCLKN